MDGHSLSVERPPLSPQPLFLDRAFFLLMTLPVLGYGYGLLPLGTEGWKLLGAAIGVGTDRQAGRVLAAAAAWSVGGVLTDAITVHEVEFGGGSVILE